MNKEINNIWERLGAEKYIFTKHNFVNVYNFAEIKSKLTQGVKKDLAKEKGFNNILEFEEWLSSITQIDKNIIESEINKKLNEKKRLKQIKVTLPHAL